MHKSSSFSKSSAGNKGHLSSVQTEELIADLRSIQSPSQRVEEKLAACAGFSRSITRRDEDSHAPRRPR